MPPESKRERISVRLTKRYMRLLNELVEKGVYNSRNEAIRTALRLLFEQHGLKVFNATSSDKSRSRGP